MLNPKMKTFSSFTRPHAMYLTVFFDRQTEMLKKKTITDALSHQLGWIIMFILCGF